MHVISYRRLGEYGEKHSACREPLDNWYKIARKAAWSVLVEVQSVFPKAEAVGNFPVFNIKGNKYRYYFISTQIHTVVPHANNEKIVSNQYNRHSSQTAVATKFQLPMLPLLLHHKST